MPDNRDNSDKISLNTRRAAKKEVHKKRGLLKLICIIAGSLVFLYILGACISTFTSNLTVTDALNGSVTEEIRTSGYVYRTQNVINAPWNGHYESLVSEGERVKAGQVIGYIYHVAPSSDIMDEIRRLQRLIRLNDAFEDEEYIAGGTGAAEKKLSELSRDLSDERQGYDLSLVEDKKEEINILLERKSDVADVSENTEEDDTKPSGQDNMKAELSQLEAQAGESVKIVAEVGGVFSSKIDGLESELAYENADAVVPSKLKELDKIESASNSSVIAGQPLCKIVNNYVWKYATVISEKEAEALSVGQGIQMGFYDLAVGTIKGTISRISEIEGGKRAIVISANRYVDGIYATSRASADIVTVDCSGIKLPSGCIRVKDGVTGVYVIRLDKAHFVPVNLIYRNDEWAIVSAAEPELGGKRLQIYDEVIIECKNLEDGKVVR